MKGGEEMKDRVLAIVNPVSGNGKTGKAWPGFAERFRRAGIAFDTVYTGWPKHATELARKGLKQGYSRIMAVGGDGTVNEVVNGFFEDEHLLVSDSRLIVFSRGTGSDYIKSLGITNRVEEIIRVIKRDRVKFIDLGLVTYVTHSRNREERYFINVADMGIGGETTNLVNRSSKLFGGLLTYLFGALRVLITYQNKVMKLTIDGEEILPERLNSVMVANGEFFAGGMRIAPGADLEDGRFNILKIGDLTKFEFITNIIKAYRGTHLTHPKVNYVCGRELSIDSEERVLIEVDGETVGYLPAKFKILEKRLPVCY